MRSFHWRRGPHRAGQTPVEMVALALAVAAAGCGSWPPGPEASVGARPLEDAAPADAAPADAGSDGGSGLTADGGAPDDAATPPGCGDGVIDGLEECDRFDFGGASCLSFPPFNAGALTCRSDCQFSTGGCSICGNGEADGLEECDGEDLRGYSCETLGYDGGAITCESDCCMDVSGCVDP